jgi:AcrR family transcriptional regulator
VEYYVNTMPKPTSKLTILTAARTQFARAGYEKTTIRGIAQAAGVDAALVMHYFGTKQKLFMTVMLPLAQQQLDTRIEHLRTAMSIEQLVDIWVPMISSTLADSEFRQLFVGLIRAAASESEAAGMLRDVIASRISHLLEHLVPEQEAKLRASLIGSTFIGIITARYIIKAPGIASASPEDIARYVQPVLRHYLTMPL